MAPESLRPQAGRSRSGVALLALAALAIAGCQLVPRNRADGSLPAPEQQAQAPAQTEEPGPPLPLGETRNRIAVLVPLTGPNAAVGQSIANAANLALADSGSDRIRVTAYDTAPGALLAVNEALAEGNGLVLGPLLAEDARAIAPAARQANVPVVAFSNDVGIAGDGVYVLGLDPGQSIDRVVAYAREHGAQRFAALIPTTAYGERAGRALAAAVQRTGGTLVAVRTYGRSAEALRAAAAQLNAQAPFDAVLIADGARMAALAVPIVRRGAPDARILGTDLWSGETALGAQAALRGAWFAGLSGTRFEQLRTRYRARYSTVPHRLGSLGYDAVLLAARVDWRLGRRFPVRALGAQDGFAGVDGAFRFGRDGIAERALDVIEVTAAGTTVVSAAPPSFAR
jgi:branched-chain amino acid transport system substrate-binding protein